MKSLFILLALAVSFALLVPLLSGEWGGRSCPVGQAVFAQAPAQLLWKKRADQPFESYLYQGQTQIGSYCHERQLYWPIVAGQWQKPTQPPIPPPELPPGTVLPGKLKARPDAKQPGDLLPEPVIKNFGIDLASLGTCTQCKYWRRGVEMSKEQAWEAIGSGGKQLVDDRDAPWLVAIGPEQDRKRFFADAEKHLDPELRARLRLASLAPEDWRCKDTVTGELLYCTTGTPTIYCQAPDGTVLHRQDDYKGPEDFGAIRKSYGYDPKKDTDLRRVDLAGLGLAGWLAIGVAIYLVVRGSGASDAEKRDQRSE